MGYLNGAFGVLLVFLMVNTAMSQDQKAPPPPGGFPADHGLSVNSTAPDFAYETLSGKEIKLSDYRGQYVLIDFWGTWCEPCLKEMPYLKEAYAKYSGDIKFIGVAADDDKEAVINYVDQNNVPWAQIVVPLDLDDPVEILEEYNVQLFPSVFLIDPDGNVINGAQSHQEKDKLSGDELITTLDKALHR